ncbi:MAG: hypothetical protein ACLFSY_06625 [Desulfonatronovibrionaceae bacterium]
MLIIKCSGCKRKLLKYRKIGPGAVLRCHKSRVDKWLDAEEKHGKLLCLCGRVVGLDKGTYYKMIRKAFTYSGTKVSK